MRHGNLGFFSRPYRATTHEFFGQIVKRYKRQPDTEQIDKIIAAHGEFVKELRTAGITLPRTDIHFERSGRWYQLLIVQQPFADEELVRPAIQQQGLETCKKLMQGIMADAVKFINYRQRKQRDELGFHPTLRNYAWRDGKLFFLDTFPPMAGLSREELEMIVANFAPVPRFLRFLLLPFLTRVTNEYYDSVEMLVGIVGSCCRLRPEWIQDFLEAARAPLSELDSAEVRANTLARLQEPPRLSKLWVGARRLLRKEGAPNVSRSR